MARLGYLLAAPFRYSPLRHGSRFGIRHEPGIFYGSLTVQTLLAEAAFYRFLFWHDMATPPRGPLTTQHTAFAARYATRQGVQLQATRFESHGKTLRHRSDYRATQTLGTAMREAGVEAFEYSSARDPDAGVNVGLSSPAALADTRPHGQEPWIAETATDAVTFVGGAPRSVHRFTLDAFLARGRLARAAAWSARPGTRNLRSAGADLVSPAPAFARTARTPPRARAARPRAPASAAGNARGPADR